MLVQNICTLYSELLQSFLQSRSNHLNICVCSTQIQSGFSDIWLQWVIFLHEATSGEKRSFVLRLLSFRYWSTQTVQSSCFPVIYKLCVIKQHGNMEAPEQNTKVVQTHKMLTSTGLISSATQSLHVHTTPLFLQDYEHL